MTNRLYYGDNLDVLRTHIGDESVDLIYLDPPFNSNAGYNVLFKAASGAGADASIEAFDDTWTWGDSAKDALMDIAAGTNRPLTVMMEAMRGAVGENPLMAYLAMMAVRLVELHRVLRPTGSLYLHCDPTASHYLKLVLDAVFGQENFRTEISWKRQTAHNDAAQGRKQYGNIRDIILFYSKSKEWTFNWLYTPYSDDYVEKFGRHIEPKTGRRYFLGDITAPGGASPAKRNPHYEFLGVTRYWRFAQERMERMFAEGRIVQSAPGRVPRQKRYLDEMPGVALQNDWSDILPVQPNSKVDKALGYPTQKPRALLERIIAASSNPGDVVLDPFCGCGTAVDAAQKLGRRWIGIDVTHIAIGMIEDRMRSGYPGIAFETVGVPRDIDSALRLAADDKHQFQQWACWKVGGYPRDKKGGDKGVDGWFNYLNDDAAVGGGRIATGVISVKGGEHLNPGMVRDLGRVMERDKHAFGLFVVAAMPTKGVRDEIASHPLIETQFGRFPAMQVVTIAELIHGPPPKLPPLISPVKKASRVETRASHQKGSQGSLL